MLREGRRSHIIWWNYRQASICARYSSKSWHSQAFGCADEFWMLKVQIWNSAYISRGKIFTAISLHITWVQEQNIYSNSCFC